MPGGAGGRVVAEAPEALMRRLAGDAERVGDLGPCRPPVQGAADEPLEVGLGGVDDVDLSGRLVEGVGLVSFGSLHVCQATLTASRLSGYPDCMGRGSWRFSRRP